MGALEFRDTCCISACAQFSIYVCALAAKNNHVTQGSMYQHTEMKTIN